jgi:putative MATE family efflux protein
MPYAFDYIRFILLGAPFMIGSLMLNNLLRFQGSAFLGMIGMTSGAVLNVGLDPLFIFVFHLGVKGASLATMLSQALSCILLFALGCTGRQNIRILPRNFAPSIRTYREMLRGGSPSLFRQGMLSFSTILLYHAAGAYGDAVIAAISIVNRLFMLLSSAMLGLGQGFQPVCGFNYGAKLYGRVKKAFWFCLGLSSALLTVLGVICFFTAPGIIALFRRDDPDVIRIGALSLRFQCFTFPLAGWIVLNNMMLQTMGKAVPASILAFARQGLFLIPLLYTVAPLFGVLGIQLCIPISDALTFLLTLWFGISVLRKDLAE